ncbi:MAG: hypothetical protein GYB67_14630 [Chloroflexi bacterium]|nr:hypothetical protein [Chloroflexota bacterium]
MDQHYQQWSQLAPRGLLVIGLGASLLGFATNLRARQRPSWQWVVMGTIGLITLNAGVSIFGESVKHRTLYEQKLGL